MHVFEIARKVAKMLKVSPFFKILYLCSNKVSFCFYREEKNKGTNNFKFDDDEQKKVIKLHGKVLDSIEQWSHEAYRTSDIEQCPKIFSYPNSPATKTHQAMTFMIYNLTNFGTAYEKQPTFDRRAKSIILFVS